MTGSADLGERVVAMLSRLIARIPDIGVVVFSMASVPAVVSFIESNAGKASWIYWSAAIVGEAVTAWMISSATGAFYSVTRSNTSKQDRRLAIAEMTAYFICAMPTLIVSYVSNRADFGGVILLGAMFPGLAVGCAIGGTIPRVVGRRRREMAAERAEQSAERAARKAARAKEKEQERIQKEQERIEKEKKTCQTCGKETTFELTDGQCHDCQRVARGEAHALPLELSLAVLERDDWRCFYCGTDLRRVPAGARQIDHFIPKSREGTNDADNLVTACTRCNQSKSDHMPSERDIWRLGQYLFAKAQGSEKKSQILALASTNNGRIGLNQRDIVEVLKVSQGYVSTVLRDATNIDEIVSEAQNEEGS